jgi:hypothetical protein
MFTSQSFSINMTLAITVTSGGKPALVYLYNIESSSLLGHDYSETDLLKSNNLQRA